MKVRDFLTLHKTDRQVLLTLLAVAVAALAVVVFTKNEEMPKSAIPSDFKSDSVGLSEHHDGRSTGAPYYQPANVAAPQRFAFDPNTADSTTLLQLGLSPFIVRNIYKYRAKGGIFRQKEDFARLYGLTVKEYRELEPYITIGADYQPATTLIGRQQEQPQNDTLRYPAKLAQGETIDLGQADTTLLKRVPGIGSYYARRISEYRQRLGGYATVDQLDEIADFPMESKVFFTIDTISTRKMNINQLSLEQLKRHPYINFYQARAIVEYRRQHGSIGDLSDLRLCPEFTAAGLERLRPYVEY